MSSRLFLCMLVLVAAISSDAEAREQVWGRSLSCPRGEMVRIGNSNAYACMATYDASNDYGSLHEILIDPERTSSVNPSLGPDLAAAIQACLDPSSVLNLDVDLGISPGCLIKAAAGTYTDDAASMLNHQAIDTSQRAAMVLDLSGVELYLDIPSFTETGRTVAAGASQLGTCSFSAFGDWYQVDDAESQFYLGAGGGTEIVGAFCNGNTWVAGWTPLQFGGPASATSGNWTVYMPSLVGDTDNTNSKAVGQRYVSFSADAGANGSDYADGGFKQFTLVGGAARLSNDLYQIGLDIGGSVGGSGSTNGVANSAETRAEGVTVIGFDADFISDTGCGIWVRNSANVALIATHTEHGGRTCIGENQANEERPDGVSLVSPHVEGSNDGPSLIVYSGVTSCVGCEIAGDKDGADAGDILQLGGSATTRTIFTSHGARWESDDDNEGQIIIAGDNVQWNQVGGQFVLADGHTGGTSMITTSGSPTGLYVRLTGYDEAGSGNVLHDLTESSSICIQEVEGDCIADTLNVGSPGTSACLIMRDNDNGANTACEVLNGAWQCEIDTDGICGNAT